MQPIITCVQHPPVDQHSDTITMRYLRRQRFVLKESRTTKESPWHVLSSDYNYEDSVAIGGAKSTLDGEGADVRTR